MNVPFLDLKAQHAPLKNELLAAFGEVIDTCAFAGGTYVAKFEAEFAQFSGAAHAIGLGNGTDALWLALLARGIGPGDEVITVPNTFIATAEAISYTGAKPVFVDVDEKTYTMDPALLERAITPRTKAIIPVHLYGQMADMDPIMEIARRHKLVVIEDACQAHGAEYKGRKAGTIGDAGCFSFYPGKNLGACGEGGAVVTNDPALAAQVRVFRDHGQQKKYFHSHIGWNCRMDGIQGVALSIKLRHLASGNEARRAHAAQYNALLGGQKSEARSQTSEVRSQTSEVRSQPTSDLQPSPSLRLAGRPLTSDHRPPTSDLRPPTSDLRLPTSASGRVHVWHLYVVRVPNRDAVMKALEERGIHCAIHYPKPVHLQEAYASLGLKPGSFPVSERTAPELLSLPMYPELKPEQIDYVAKELKAVLAEPKARVA